MVEASQNGDTGQSTGKYFVYNLSFVHEFRQAVVVGYHANSNISYCCLQRQLQSQSLIHQSFETNRLVESKCLGWGLLMTGAKPKSSNVLQNILAI